MLFEPRANLKPYEYPEFGDYKDAIRHAYWVHTEFNLTQDVQDFHALPEHEKEAVVRTMLAIAQVEVNVKTFWGDLYNRMPKPEVGAVGQTFAESEVRHQDAYAFLLERLGLNDRFNQLSDVPAIADRIDYMNAFLEGKKRGTDPEFAESIMLFSIFTEHVSLFSQFLIMMAFNRERKTFKGLSNIVEATSKEEQIHGMFGVKVIETLKSEYPHYFENFEQVAVEACQKAYMAEEKILDWIFEEGELDFLPVDTIKHFLRNRFNESLKSVGVANIFAVDESKVRDTLWFDEEIIAGKHTDFFDKRPVSYSKRTKSVTEEDLF